MVLSAMLAGCFQPMYAQRYNSDSVPQELARTFISNVDTRIAQQIRNELIFHFSGSGQQGSSDYRLDLSVRPDLTSMIVSPNRDADVRVLLLRVRFTLTEQATGVVLFAGATEARASYEYDRQLFANQRALIDAENRAAGSAAEDIRLRVSAFFASRDRVKYQVSQPVKTQQQLQAETARQAAAPR